jgi:hypothetical protein
MNSQIIVASEHGIRIDSLADISNVVGQTIDTDDLILTESDLSAEFFRLRSGLSGDVFH